MKAKLCFPIQGFVGNVSDNSRITWSFQRNIQIVKKTPEKSRILSSKQKVVVQYLRQVEAGWGALTAEQQDAWYLAASSEPALDDRWRCGKSGHNLYRSVNLLRRFGVGDLQADPPATKTPNPVVRLGNIVYQPSFPRVVTQVYITSTAARNTRLFYKFSAPSDHEGIPYSPRSMFPARDITVQTYSAPNVQAQPSSNAWGLQGYDWSAGRWVWVDLETYSLDMYPDRCLRGLRQIIV